ncbi:hypothetical protein FJW07_03580 [Mesorhizobium sp. B3-1-9]|uniref:hypothetical protein n=1 Tax=Mesorhizobium sp. B3-1-9 TaxID=2589892 RepID=UPI00112AD85C|nr:hypothetical protein [Mesorhizobium sp. B3-1-9]TPI41604.1 hypothetical protein FJW07_03580 [Mesorhizobium sp. B3-1-9]
MKSSGPLERLRKSRSAAHDSMSCRDGALRPQLPAKEFFGEYGAGLLIVPALFFIQRRDGEVAEWSKALPC